ncbi:MAG: hypothetical protein KAR31_02520, partial [Candidatus Omnitrophica bacterium]|nr:hypothetical protein [Candidatus Omnitrophota bacterium]
HEKAILGQPPSSLYHAFKNVQHSFQKVKKYSHSTSCDLFFSQKPLVAIQKLYHNKGQDNSTNNG